MLSAKGTGLEGKRAGSRVKKVNLRRGSAGAGKRVGGYQAALSTEALRSTFHEDKRP